MIPSGRRLLASSYIRNLSLWAPISKDMQIFKSKDSSRIHLTLDFRWEQLPGTWIFLLHWDASCTGFSVFGGGTW